MLTGRVADLTEPAVRPLILERQERREEATSRQCAGQKISAVIPLRPHAGATPIWLIPTGDYTSILFPFNNY